ncbi:MAG: L-threonylcarbamoyladenylate synthase [Gaiellaceae bacterium]
MEAASQFPSDVDAVVEAILAGLPVLLPTDTVYGLCVTAYREEPARRLYRLKGRDRFQPTALVATTVDMLFECVPELRGRAGTVVRALLPGAYTLIVPNPGGRYRWLTGASPETLGVRVPALEGSAAEVLARVATVAATSANLPGEPDPRRLEDVPEELRAGCASVLDGGELPGTPSTVIDVTGDKPYVLREGAGPVEEALERIRGALT